MLFRKVLPTAITLITGIIVTLAYFLDVPFLASTANTFMQWRALVAVFALGVGVVNIIRVHSRAVKKDGLKSWYSLALLLTMIMVAIAGFTTGKDAGLYAWMFTNISVPTNGAILALLAFYIGTAAYRAFRAKNSEAAVLLACGLIVMFGRVPLGAKILPFAPPAMDWILSVLNAGGQRGVTIAGAIGFIAVSLRIIAGLERRSYGANRGRDMGTWENCNMLTSECFTCFSACHCDTNDCAFEYAHSHYGNDEAGSTSSSRCLRLCSPRRVRLRPGNEIDLNPQAIGLFPSSRQEVQGRSDIVLPPTPLFAEQTMKILEEEYGYEYGGTR